MKELVNYDINVSVEGTETKLCKPGINSYLYPLQT